MKKKILQKGVISSVVLFQFGLSFPWHALPISANVQTEETQGENQPLASKDKVTEKDLPKDVQEKLNDSVKNEKEPTLPEKSKEISDEIVQSFEKETKHTLEEVKETEEKSGKVEDIQERTEYAKTFVNPQTGEGETILFTRPIHEKDESGLLQEIETVTEEKKEKIVFKDTTVVEVPKTLEETQPLKISDETSVLAFSIPNETLTVEEKKDDKVLLSNAEKSVVTEVAKEPQSTTVSQFVSEETLKTSITYQLSLQEGEKVVSNRIGMTILKGEEVKAVITSPTLESLDGSIITPLSFLFNEKTNTISVTGIKEETLKEVKQAKVSMRAMTETNVTIHGVESTSIRQYDDKLPYYFQNYMMIGYDDGYLSGDDGAAHFITYGILNIPNAEFQKVAKTHEIMNATLKLKRIGAPGFWGDRAKDSQGNIVTRVYEAAPLTKNVGSLTTLTYDKFISQLKSPVGSPAYEDGKETKLGKIDVNNRWVDFDFTIVANQWKNGELANNGLLVRNQKNTVHEKPYSIAELFGGKGYTGAEPYVVLSHREKPPIDKNMPLRETTLTLRPFVRSDNDGLVQFSALGMDGKGRPDAKINYRVVDTTDNKVAYSGMDPAIGRDYLYPNYPVLFQDAQKYKDLSSNWQTNDLLTTVLKENHLYKVEATVTFEKNGTTEKAEKTYDTFQLYKIKSQDTLPRLLAFYGLTKHRASFMRDNNMKDELLTQGNLVFIRNPKKNAGKAYTPAPLSKAEKIRLDSLAMGRGKHCQFGFEPINLGSGNFLYEMTDATWYDLEKEEQLKRTYNAMGQGVDSPVGRNWSVNTTLELTQLEDKSMMLSLEDGGKVFFQRNANGTYSPEDTVPFRLVKTKEVVGEVEKRLFLLEDTQKQLTYTFNAMGQIRTIRNTQGQTKTYTYDNETGNVKDIQLFNGQKVQFSWDELGHMTSFTTPNGSKTTYEYDSQGNLVKVVDPTGKTFTYQYDNEHRMTSYKGHDGNVIYANKYDSQNRVVEQTDAAGNTVKLSYDKNRTTTTDGNGNKTTTTYNDHFQPTKIVYPDGKEETNTYNANHQLLENVNRQGQKTTYVYDHYGNLTKTTYPDGTSESTTYNAFQQPLVETNRQGKQKVSTYDAKGNLTSVVDEAGNQTTYTYNAQGQKMSETNPQGETKTYTYDNKGNLASESDALGLIFSYTYDQNGLLLTQTDGKGNTKTFERNARGELVKESNFNGQFKTYRYDAEGNKTSETDFNGNQTTYTYNAIGQLIQEENAVGGKKTFRYDGNGNVLEESDFLGNLKKMKYNALNQRVELTLADGSTTKYEYDTLGNLTKEMAGNGSVTTYRYDMNGFLIESENANGEKTTYIRNTQGLPVKITYPDNATECFEYDNLGNLTKKTEKNGRETTYTYNAKSENVANTSENRTSRQTFDVRGNLTKSRNALNEEETTTFDVAGFVKESKDAQGNSTTYETDGEGNVTKTTLADGSQYQYVYDGVGNKLKEIDPSGKETRYTYNKQNLLETKIAPTGDIEQYRYDKNGQVVEKIDPMGNSTTYAYTPTGEIKTVTDPLGNVSRFAYDEVGNVTTFTDTIGRVTKYEYNLLHQLIKETTPMGVVTTYSYDKAGSLTKVEDTTKQKERYTYDISGNLTSITDSQNRVERFTYNRFGEKVSATDIQGNKTEYTQDALGRVIKTTKPQGVSEENRYDPRGNLIEAKRVNDGVTKYEYNNVGNLVREINAQNKDKFYTYNALSQLTEVRDENGGKTTFAYDALGRVTQTKDANGAIAKRSYDGNGNVIKEVDGEGHSTTYAYNALNQRIETVDAKGFKQTTSYDAAGRKVSESDFKGNLTTYKYDPANNLIETTDPLQRTSHFTYDLKNQLLEAIDSTGAKTSYTYHADGTLKSEENAKGYVKNYHYDSYSQLIKTTDNVHKQPLSEISYDSYGQVVKEVKSGKQVTSYDYDKVGRLVKLTYPDKTNVSYTYDNLDRISQMIDVRGNATKLVYDGLGNVKELTAPTGAVTKYEYDGVGNLLKEIDPLQYATSFAYNQNNQVTQTTNANHGMVKQTYDERNQLATSTNERGFTTQQTHDGNGNVTAIMDAKGNKQQFAYDKANRLTTTTSRLGKATHYAYDEQDNLTNITDANNGTTTMEYSPTGELESLTSANGRKETFRYRLDGQLTQNKKASGESIIYGYDELNRQIGKRMKQQDFVYTYDDGNRLTSAEKTQEVDFGEVDEVPELAEKLPSKHKVTFTYNQFGDLTQATTSDMGEVHYVYDAYGRRTQVQYPNGTNVQYEYDQKNQLTKVTDKGKVTEYSYDGMGQITKIQHADGTTSLYSYLPTGEVSESKILSTTGKELSKQTYEYDENGNLTREMLNYPKLKLDRSYEYDKEDQLVKVTEKERNTTRVTQYFYDNVGNRVATRLDVNGQFKGISEWKHNADNQLNEITGESGATYEYDNNGNVSKKQSANGEVTLYRYDVEGRLTEESSTWGKQIFYVYDALGNRILKGNYTEKARKLKTNLREWMKGVDRTSQLSLKQEDITLEDALNAKREVKCLSSKEKTWIKDHTTPRREQTEEKLKKELTPQATVDLIRYLNDYAQEFVSPLMQTKESYDKRVKKTATATNVYDTRGVNISDDLDTFHQDGLGSNITQTQKENGILYSSNAYESFGRSERPIEEQRGYRSQYHDDWNVQNLRARVYQTQLGRFTQEDSYRGEIDNPISQNRYTYVWNNPNKYRDDSGHVPMQLALDGGGGGSRVVYGPPAPKPTSYLPPRNTNPHTMATLEKVQYENYKAQQEAQRQKNVEQALGIYSPAIYPALSASGGYSSNFIGPLPQGARRSSATPYVPKLVTLNGQFYDLNNPQQLAVYGKKVAVIETRKRGLATVKKQCEDSKDNVLEDNSSKYNLVQVTDSVEEVYKKYIELSKKGVHPHTGKKISDEEAKKFQYAAWAGTITDFAGTVYGAYYVSKGTVDISGKNKVNGKKTTNGQSTGRNSQSIAQKSLNDLPSHVQDIYQKYEKGGWKGNVAGQTQGTGAGGAYKNRNSALPTIDSNGKTITYKEFDVNNYNGINRDSERFVRGSDGSTYYTDDHYRTFTKIK